MAENMGGAFQLANAYEKQQEIQEQRQDQQHIQNYLKEGGNFNTPEGLAAAAEKLKGVVSPKTTLMLTQAQSEMKLNSAKQEEAYAKMQPELLEGQGTKGEQGALQDFEAAKNQIIQNASQQQMPGGKPMINPQLLKQFESMNPAQVQSALMGTKYQQERLKSGLEIQLKQAQIDKEKALALKYSKASKAGAAGIPEYITDSEATGQEFLDLLEPGQAVLVKAVADGRMQLSDLRGRGEQAKIAQLVNQYDPAFKAYSGKNIAFVEKDFTSGPTSKNITSINTAIGHLGSLEKLGEAMQNGDMKTANRLLNAAKTEFGNPNATNYELAQIAVGEELMRTFRGVGASVTEAEQWKSKLDGSMTPQQMRNVVKTAAELLESRISAIDSQWKRGTKSDKGYQDILDPHAVDVLSAFTGKDYWSMYNLSGKGRASSVGGKSKQSAEVSHGTTPAKNSQGWALHKDAKGNMAYVGPKGEVQEVK